MPGWVFEMPLGGHQGDVRAPEGLSLSLNTGGLICPAGSLECLNDDVCAPWILSLSQQEDSLEIRLARELTKVPAVKQGTN